MKINFRHTLKTLLIFSILFHIFSFNQVAAADSPFSVSMEVTYKVDPSGNTTVTQNIHLTNLSTERFASEYVLKINGSKIYNLRSYDQKGALEITRENNNGINEIHLKFNDRKVGIDKTLNWTIVYESPSIATRVGRLWKVQIPPEHLDQFTQNVTVGIYVPDQFGRIISQKPLQNAGKNFWTISKSSNAGISLIYDPIEDSAIPYQLYDFKLTYHLKNNEILTARREIALPPDTSYQKVFLNSLIPAPSEIKSDQDGNWIASFSLAPFSSQRIFAAGQIAAFQKPQSESISPEKLKSYLNSARYWQASDNQIIETSGKLQSAQNIYRFVVNKLTYDKTRPVNNKERLGAKKVLQNSASAICMEFTDLFIALARAAKIPSREIVGYGFSLNSQRQPAFSSSDILHAWPQYYDKKTHNWRMVDPTWEKTTGGIDYFHNFDFDHIAFVIHGQNSSFPKPAGAYKFSGVNSPDIDIRPSAKSIDLSAPDKLQIELKQKEIFPPMFTTIEVLIKNAGSGSIVNKKLSVFSSVSVIPQTITIASLPPLGTFETKIFINSPPVVVKDHAIITFGNGEQIIKKTLTIKPFFDNPLILIPGGLIILVFISITTKIPRRLFFQKRQQ